MLNYSIVDKIIKNALEEDIPYGDITAKSEEHTSELQYN